MKRKRGSFHTLTSVNSIKLRVPGLWVTGVKFRVRGPWVTGAKLRVPVRTTHQTELMMINADSLDKKNLNEERNRKGVLDYIEFPRILGTIYFLH